MARHFVPDDRHHITDPYADPDRWARSVTQGRIAELFLTAPGLVGHAAQVQQEIKRVISSNNLGKMEGKTGADVVDLIGALELVKSAIVAAAKAATFDFTKFGLDFGTLTGPMFIERKGGRVYRDGKPAD